MGLEVPKNNDEWKAMIAERNKGAGKNEMFSDLSQQFKWHDSFRDSTMNMYRSTYQDMNMRRETAVVSNFPSGYGGHVPRVGHDELFDNTSLSKTFHKRAHDPARDTFPSFAQQKSGCATFTTPKQAEAPSWGTLANCQVQPPWGVCTVIRELPNQRMIPPNIPDEDKN